MVTYICSRPTGKYARVLWYLYEKLRNEILPLPDIGRGSYVPLLDPEKYYVTKGRTSTRHRVEDNLLGSLEFAPIVRKTERIKAYEEKELHKQAREVVRQYDSSLLARAMQYLYAKETMSSWEIEGEQPDKARLMRFVNLLHKADSIGPLSEQTLVSLQKEIVDPRFALGSYRDFQNYVGEEPGLGQMIVHYIAPRPQDVSLLMSELLHAFKLMEDSKISPVVAATVLSFGFVFIHPFEDGNGRIHRFLIHYALQRLGFSSAEIVFPVSSAILRAPQHYDKALERFSKPLMQLITNYEINELGQMQVLESTIDLYRFIDFTSLVEYLFECVETTIITDLQQELVFLADYDGIKKRCKEVLDMPDQRIDFFIKCVRQNGGKLSKRKRESFFGMLTDEEIERLEKAINAGGVIL